MLIAILLLGSAPPADGDAADAAFRAHVARLFGADCERARAPNARQAAVLHRLCVCSDEQIRASDISLSDGQDGVTAKVHRAQEACLRRIYGNGPGGGRATH